MTEDLEMCSSCGCVKPPKDLTKLPKVTLANGAGEVVVFVDDEIICLVSVREHEGKLQRAFQTVVHRRHLAEVMNTATKSYVEWSPVTVDVDTLRGDQELQ